MTIALGLVALCLLLLGAAVGATALPAVRVRHWLGGAVRGLVALLLLALAALAATVTVGLQGYRALTFEEVAATVRTEPVDLCSMARRRLLGPLVDAEYGSATFVAATRPAIFEVRVSTTGLLARPVPSRPTP